MNRGYKQQVIAIRLAEPHLKYREIAARIGCAENTVAQVCSQTGLKAGYRRADNFSEVLRLGYAAHRAGLTLEQLHQLELMANARHA